MRTILLAECGSTKIDWVFLALRDNNEKSDQSRQPTPPSKTSTGSLKKGLRVDDISNENTSFGDTQRDVSLNSALLTSDSSHCPETFRWTTPGLNPFFESSQERAAKLQEDLEPFWQWQNRLVETDQTPSFGIHSPKNAPTNSPSCLSNSPSCLKIDEDALNDPADTQRNSSGLQKSTIDLATKAKASRTVQEVWFYGAGLTSEAKGADIRQTFGDLFPLAHIETCSDLLAAARGLLGTTQGIACILGTGANSGFYDGHQFLDQVPAGGFILGDEGSGAWLGRHLISDYLKRQLPPKLADQLREEYLLTTADILESVYRRPFPNRFLGQFTPFLKKNLSVPYCQNLVQNGMEQFFRRNINHYPQSDRVSLTATGSIAWAFDRLFHKTATRFGWNVTSLQKSPLDGLIHFHSALRWEELD